MNNRIYRHVALKPDHGSYLLVVLALLVLTAIGYYCAHTMDAAGHHITGMNNSVVWGLPHVFAVSLIVAASGALNGASFSTVFAMELYKPYSRLSVALAMALLLGGLAILVLDLGRPDRLFIAMTTFNFRSVFAWNIFLYSGFMLICGVYLWMLCERRFNRHAKKAGVLAFVWRLVLTTGTGCIFGFLVGRNALDSALLAPLFIALSLAMGTAVFAIVLLIVARWCDEDLPAAVERSLCRLLFWFLLGLGYFSIVHHLTNLYVSEHRASEQLVLAGTFAPLFWLGHVFVGLVLPVAILCRVNTTSGKVIAGSAGNKVGSDTGKDSNADTRNKSAADSGNYIVQETDKSRVRMSRHLLTASVVAIAGNGALLYVIIIGSQTTAQRLFPGKSVVASSFGDMGLASYQPSLWEWGLGAGGLALALLLFVVSLRVFPFTAVYSSRRH